VYETWLDIFCLVIVILLNIISEKSIIFSSSVDIWHTWRRRHQILTLRLSRLLISSPKSTIILTILLLRSYILLRAVSIISVHSSTSFSWLSQIRMYLILSPVSCLLLVRHSLRIHVYIHLCPLLYSHNCMTTSTTLRIRSKSRLTWLTNISNSTCFVIANTSIKLLILSFQIRLWTTSIAFWLSLCETWSIKIIWMIYEFTSCCWWYLHRWRCWNTTSQRLGYWSWSKNITPNSLALASSIACIWWTILAPRINILFYIHLMVYLFLLISWLISSVASTRMVRGLVWYLIIILVPIIVRAHISLWLPSSSAYITLTWMILI
jgi:hypothetical protein